MVFFLARAKETRWSAFALMEMEVTGGPRPPRLRSRRICAERATPRGSSTLSARRGIRITIARGPTSIVVVPLIELYTAPAIS